MKIGIIGMGLMGTSMAMALKKYIGDISIFGQDKDERHLNYVLTSNIITEKLERTNSRELDLLFLAVPVKKTKEVLGAALPDLDIEKVLVTDMGSTKSYVCNEIKKEYPFIDFIGGHPMTGLELCGPEAASSKLFRNRTYVLIEPENFETKLEIKKKLLVEILKKIGAEVIMMNSDTHDELTAVTSHLPHFLAASFVKEVIETERKHPEVYRLMGQGFRDFTRIAGSNPDIWKDIFLTNREFLLDKINKMNENILLLRDILHSKDEERLQEFLISTSAKRISLKEKLKEVKI